MAHLWKFILLHHYVLGYNTFFVTIFSLHFKLQAVKARDIIHGFVCIPIILQPKFMVT